jgi:hypothetical protein
MRHAAFVAACFLVGGCMSVDAPAQQATFENVSLLQMTDIPSIAIDSFRIAPGLPPQVDESIGIRADTLKAPGGSFSQYLRKTFETELTAAGKLNPEGATALSGELTRSEVKTSPAGSGVLAARFTAARNGQVIFKKEIAVTDTWKFDFIGALAIPEAMNRYTALYPKLVTALFNDAEFRQALRAP